MKIWNQAKRHLPNWFSSFTNRRKKSKKQVKKTEKAEVETGDTHLEQAKVSLRQLLLDANVPTAIREHLGGDYKQLQTMLDKLEHGHIHIGVFGLVSVGKSSLLNALLGKEQFAVSVLHGKTKTTDMERWQEHSDGNVFLIDTPGINEVNGHEREALAHEVANRVDLLLFVVDSDLTDVELQALKIVSVTRRPIILVVNKADQYTEQEHLELRTILKKRTAKYISPENIVFTTAQPPLQKVIYIDDDGNETETVRQKPVNIIALKSRLWDIIESEGKTLSALNASLFAGQLSAEVSRRILRVRQHVGRKVIQYYCIGKSLSVAINPIPILDIFAAAAIDVSMVLHLAKLYGLPMSKSEAGELITTIFTHMLLLIGTTWAVNIASSALKLGTAGLSTILTAVTQGALTYYSTLVIGRVTEQWLSNGKSWGETGPKFVVQQILDSLDRNSVMTEAKKEILTYLRQKIKKK